MESPSDPNPARWGGDRPAKPQPNHPPWEIEQPTLNFIGVVGAAMTIALWLSPVQHVWTGKESVFATKSTKCVATALPYVAGFFNCLLWNMYSSSNVAHFRVPLFMNSVGLLLNLSFTQCYWR